MKKIKNCGIVLVGICICYFLLLTAETINFNNNLGTKPLITIGSNDVYIEAESNSRKEKIWGIGYCVEYEYVIETKENSDNQLLRPISAELKLFNKIILSDWIV